MSTQEAKERQDERDGINVESKLNRRDFLKGGLALGVAGMASGALAGCSPQAPTAGQTSSPANDSSLMTLDKFETEKWSFEIPPEPIADSDIAETIESEVVVVGGGMSGMCCGCSASMAGADVVVVTASSKPIGRGGSNNAIGSKYQKEMGVDYDPQKAQEIVKVEQLINSFNLDTKKWATWVNRSAEFMDWQIDIMAEVGLKPCLENAYVDPDGITSCPPSAHNFWNEETPNGALEGAPQQAAGYASKIESTGGTIYYSTKALQLVRDDDGKGRVSAVIAQDKDGKYIKYVGTKAIVLATGDFSKDRDMMARYSPEAYEIFKDKITWDNIDYDAGLVYDGLYPGDGHKMALWVGAAWQKNTTCFCNMHIWPTWPNPEGLDSFFGINMDIYGERFMNEDSNIAHILNVVRHRPQEKIFYVWDADYANIRDEWNLGSCYKNVNGIPSTPASAMPEMWDGNVEQGTMIKADTIEDLLAQWDDIDQETAKKTIENWNRYCEQGYDEEFQDVESILVPVKTPPFYGAKTTPTDYTFLTVLGGPRTNSKLQICDENDEPIEGLYCVGSMIGDFYGSIYSFYVPGLNLGSVCGALPYVLGRQLAGVE
ncbi:FAD-dependent oxidoreductase [Adlercreutzia equolifaciens]|uniref:FAD-dependent oxidoreductase n=1 Tax=Adlercreutzia equolifaciens TaxID=446660 RepID=UPI0023AFF98C|nr:FAD-dependent oxidoreductase [Adlercreutzia equolifaciens]MDE8701559.1 FAD-dependent oxidoreductase [Adlercreutzia equolifaciens]